MSINVRMRDQMKFLRHHAGKGWYMRGGYARAIAAVDRDVLLCLYEVGNHQVYILDTNS